MRMTLDVKYVPMSIERSTDSTWGGIERLERTGQGGGAGGRRAQSGQERVNRMLGLVAGCLGLSMLD